MYIDINDCSKAEFAKIINRSVSMVDYLIREEIISWWCWHEDDKTIRLRPALKNYYCDFIYHLGTAGRNEELKAAVSRVRKMKIKKASRRKGFLYSVRQLLPGLYNAKFRLEVLKYFKYIGAKFKPKYIMEAEEEYAKMQEEFKTAQKILRDKILKMKIKPVQIETILLARYVDCDKFATIAEDYNYSQTHVYRLHKQGLAAVKKFCA